MTALERVRVASVYIGAIVGAGFATGKEIILFFGDGGYLAPLVTGAAMGLCSSLFLCVGKLGAQLKNEGKLGGRAISIAKIVLYGIIEICMLLTMTTMTGGMQNIFGWTQTGRLTGFLIALLCVAFSSAGAKAVGRINLALVPVLFLLLALLFFKSSKCVEPLPFDTLKSANYLSMNMLLGGCLTVKDGERAKGKDIAAIGIVCAVVLSAMTFFVYVAASDYPRSDMPIYSLCRACGLGALGAVTTGIAILTTLAGAAKSLGDGIYALVPSKTAVTSALLLLTLASYGWDFTEAVNLFYPFIAAVASGVFALAFAALAVYALSRRIKKFSYARKKE